MWNTGHQGPGVHTVPHIYTGTFLPSDYVDAAVLSSNMIFGADA